MVNMGFESSSHHTTKKNLVEENSSVNYKKFQTTNSSIRMAHDLGHLQIL